VGWLFQTKSVIQTQRNYRAQFNKQPPSDYAIRDWQRRFLETGSVHDRKRSGRQGVSDECVETIRASFVRSPTKSTRRKPHVTSSICLRATIFQNPEWTLWTYCTIGVGFLKLKLLNEFVFFSYGPKKCPYFIINDTMLQSGRSRVGDLIR
jgi:hypothetical protein